MKPYFCFSCMSYKSDSDFKQIGSQGVCKECYKEDRATFGSYGSVSYGQVMDSFSATFLISCAIILFIGILTVLLIKIL